VVPLPAVTNANGFGSLRLAVPEDATLRGASLYAQGFVLDPFGVGGLALTAGMRWTLGD
jgi:hypothetical protein